MFSPEAGCVAVHVMLQVAARVRTEDGEEQWILAEVVSYNSHNHRYVVDDIDEEGHNEKRFNLNPHLGTYPHRCIVYLSLCRRYHVSKRRIIPLPRYKVDPKVHPPALFKPKQVHVCSTCI